MSTPADWLTRPAPVHDTETCRDSRCTDCVRAAGRAPTEYEEAAAPPPVHECPDGCPDCDVTVRVADAGARALTAAVGVSPEEYDALDAHTRDHYRLMASEVMAAMSTAMLELGVARPTGDPQ